MQFSSLSLLMAIVSAGILSSQTNITTSHMVDINAGTISNLKETNNDTPSDSSADNSSFISPATLDSIKATISTINSSLKEFFSSEG
ncbi:hypothetical protein DSO57_1004401 [Entomophthora muscae]|uniref:Uncharacterized protein n=1 Tax=Entomophthora muscae TaxID=34485 RepID=A0ACC2SXK5_9FUNG|nr:hypothetical protein DSO57_1004401 [Entomophthora muscae]